MKLDAAILQFLADTIPGVSGSDWLDDHTIAGSERPKTGVDESRIEVDLISTLATVSGFGQPSYTSTVQVGLRDPEEGWHKACVDLVDHEADISAHFNHRIVGMEAVDSIADIFVVQAQTDTDIVLLVQIETDGWPL